MPLNEAQVTKECMVCEHARVLSGCMIASARLRQINFVKFQWSLPIMNGLSQADRNHAYDHDT